MKVKFGLKNVHMAPIESITGNKYVYGKVIKVPGAVNITLEPQGDSNDFYADNIKYFSSFANQGYEGDLELAMITDEIREKIFGETKDKNGGFLENANDTFTPFAFGFEIDGDVKGRKFWYYNCSCSRAKNEAKTTESSKEPSTDSMTIKAMPRETDKNVRHFLTLSDSNKNIYDKYFESVYEVEDETQSEEVTN